MSDIKEPRGFKKAWKKAEASINNNSRIQDLLKKAGSKSLLTKAALKEHWENIQTLIRLIKHYKSGTYREVALSTILFAIAGIVYFVNPFDVIPDFILGIGFLDDITVIGYVLSKIKDEIDAFLEWEQTTPIEITATDEEIN